MGLFLSWKQISLSRLNPTLPGECRTVNHRKADRPPEESGLRSRSVPLAPRAMPVTITLRNSHRIADWQPFVPDPNLYKFRLPVAEPASVRG